MRSISGIAALALIAGLTACGGGGGGTAAIAGPTPVPSASPALAGTTYIALGDDATVAIGSSACGVVSPSTLCATDTVSKTGSLQTINGGTAVNGYAQLFATALAAKHLGTPFSFAPLGVSGALVGNVPTPEPSGAPAPNFITTNADQLAVIPGIVSAARSRNTRIVITLFAGINDTIDAYDTKTCTANCTFAGTTLADSSGNVRNGSLYGGYRALLATIKSATPDEFLVIGVPDISAFPAYANASSATLLQLKADSQQANTALQDALADAALTPPYLDLYGTPLPGGSLSAQANFADGLHFNDAGYALIEGGLAALFATAYPTF